MHFFSIIYIQKRDNISHYTMFDLNNDKTTYCLCVVFFFEYTQKQKTK